MVIEELTENHHITSQTMSVEEIMKILAFKNRSFLKIENDDLVNNIFLEEATDLHNSTFTIGDDGILSRDTGQHLSLKSYRRLPPNRAASYGLVHDNSNAVSVREESEEQVTVTEREGITFNTPGENSGARFHGAAVSDGESYMLVEHDPQLIPSDRISMAMWLYLPSARASAERHILSKGASYALSIGGNNRNELKVTFFVGTILVELTYAYTPNTWLHVVAAAKSGEQKLFVNGIQVDSAPATGSLSSIDTFHLAVFGRADGTSLSPNGTALAWLSLIHGYVPDVANWITDHLNGTLNLNTDQNSELEEITTWPFIDSVEEEPSQTSGICVSDT